MNLLKILKNNLAVIILALLFIFVFFVAVLGIDTGEYGDEKNLTLPLIRQAIESGRVALPGIYFYPSLWHNLSLTGLVPEALAFLSTINTGKLDKSIAYAFRDYLAGVSETKSFHLRVRGIFIVVSILSVVWLYFLARGLGRQKWEALLAAGILGLSWEIGYHMRWIIPHMVMMQFAVLTMMCAVMAMRHDEFKKKKLWLYSAAAVAGLTTGTLYNGGVFILPAIMVFYFAAKKINMARKDILKQVVVLIAVFAVFYIITTPGTLLDPIRFAEHLLYEFKAYAIRGGIYTVTLWEHTYLLSSYFTFVVFSPFFPIALFFSTASLLGIYSFLKEDRKTASVFLVPVALFLFFLVSLKTMYARNFLPVFPFFALFAARGVSYFYKNYWQRLTTKPFHFLFLALVIFVLSVNAAWSFSAAKSIKEKDKTNYAEQLLQYINESPDKEFIVSQAVQKELLALTDELPTNVKDKFSSSKTLAVFRAFELNPTNSEQWSKWKPNRFNYTITWFGPYETNFNYYPDWQSNDRIIVMPINNALELGIF